MNDEMKSCNKDATDLRERTKAFAISVIRMFSSLPKTAEARVLGKQVLRSGTSVGASYREACCSRSKAEFIAKLGDCLKELDESSYWFELLEETGTVAASSLEPLKRECNELLAIFTTIAKKSKSSIS
jgi:four helix bundle protein